MKVRRYRLRPSSGRPDGRPVGRLGGPGGRRGSRPGGGPGSPALPGGRPGAVVLIALVFGRVPVVLVARQVAVVMLA